MRLRPEPLQASQGFRSHRATVSHEMAGKVVVLRGLIGRIDLDFCLQFWLLLWCIMSNWTFPPTRFIPPLPPPHPSRAFSLLLTSPYRPISSPQMPSYKFQRDLRTFSKCFLQYSQQFLYYYITFVNPAMFRVIPYSTNFSPSLTAITLQNLH